MSCQQQNKRKSNLASRAFSLAGVAVFVKTNIESEMMNRGSGTGGGWGGGEGVGSPDLEFPLLFHGNPASRTFFITTLNPDFLSLKNTFKSLITTKSNICKMQIGPFA